MEHNSSLKKVRRNRKPIIFFVYPISLVTEMGPEIPFEIGQFLLYKGHFLNLLHFPIWKVHTKTLLLKYDTVLADSEIAWEATDEVNYLFIEIFIMRISYRACSIPMFMKIIFY